MKMKSKMAGKLMVTGLLSAAICIFAAQAMAQSRAPQSDLEKSEAIIHGAVERNGFYQTSGPNGEFLSERNHIVFDGCKTTIHVLTVGADEPPYKRESYNFDIVFNLKEMDPKVVASPQDLNGNKLPDNREWIILRTADRGESMMIWNGKTLASVSSAYPIPAGANHEENLILTGALTRAIDLCKLRK